MCSQVVFQIQVLLHSDVCALLSVPPAGPCINFIDTKSFPHPIGEFESIFINKAFFLDELNICPSVYKHAS